MPVQVVKECLLYYGNAVVGTAFLWIGFGKLLALGVAPVLLTLGS